MQHDYFTSERFIHDGLIRTAEAGVHGLYEHWKREHKIDAFVVTWPAEAVLDDHGKTLSDTCVFELQDSTKPEWQILMLKLVQRTKAYGILFVEQRTSDIRAIFETKHGAKCWTIPIARSGDASILKKAEVTVDRENLGLLWRPKMGEA
jgi:hypothetical protein